MERLLTMDIHDTEKERDDLQLALAHKEDALTLCQADNVSLKNIANQMSQNDQQQKSVIISLEDKCAWGVELEQVKDRLYFIVIFILYECRILHFILFYVVTH